MKSIFHIFYRAFRCQKLPQTLECTFNVSKNDYDGNLSLSPHKRSSATRVLSNATVNPPRYLREHNQCRKICKTVSLQKLFSNHWCHRQPYLDFLRMIWGSMWGIRGDLKIVFSLIFFLYPSSIPVYSLSFVFLSQNLQHKFLVVIQSCLHILC